MPNRMSASRWTLAGVVAAMLLLAGCGGAAEPDGAEASDAGAAPSAPAVELSEPADQPSETEAEAPSDAAVTPDVTVVLGEWVVDPTPTSAAAGELTITADNQGGLDHEVVIVRADDPADLPTDADGAVEEAQIAEDDFIGEIEEFPSGEQRTAAFTLDAATYVLFCNITEAEDDDEVLSHFAEGMATTFSVE